MNTKRLAELQARTAQSPLPFEHALWQHHLGSVDLEKFRGHRHYLTQDAAIELYQAQVDRIRADDPWGLWDRLSEDNAFGCITHTLDGKVCSRDLLDSIEEINYLRQRLGWQQDQAVNVLDVGAGYGRLAHRLHDAMPNSRIWCTDALAESTWVCEEYLAYRGVTDRTTVVPFDTLPASLNGITFDVATAIHSWSECTPQAVHWWVGLLRNLKVPYILYIGMWSEADVSNVVIGHGYQLVQAVRGDLDNMLYLLYRLNA